MARTILTVLTIALLNVLVGCHSVDSGEAQLIPARTKQSPGPAVVVKPAKAGESDIIEQVSINRQAYRQGLELLVEHYTKTGNNMKLTWAKKELAALDDMPQYNYIIEASVAGPNLKASTSIPLANYMYQEALRLEKKAGRLVVIKNEDLLRVALEKYNQLIKKHPSSDRIDDAAFKAGGIYEYFKDYSIALLYYKRAYQWDTETIHPAKFKAACILDKHLHRRAEALELYQQAVKKETLGKKYKEFAQKRIIELTKGDETLEEPK